MYEKAMIYDLDGNFVGWTIIKDRDKLLLQTTHYWDEQDADVDEQIAKLNHLASLKPFWPTLKDPAVQALINEPEWQPEEGQTRASAAMYAVAVGRWSSSAS